MASLIPGYEYDIFISYRQKDNKYDGWVTGFVESLKRELEATFKEEVSLYFDINPHDGLLETHDVNASLKDKLKCLVFIPIVSRTYCDPKSFAWEHEFKAFIETATRDEYGLKVRLQGGNISIRVLPVQINDLDPDDKKIIEGELGGVLRGIEFIYREPGVNRPLTPDDDEKANLNKTKYRNQINKVSLAIKEIIRGMKSVSSFKTDHEEQINHEIEQIRAGDDIIVSGTKRSRKWLKLLWIFIGIILITTTVIVWPRIFKKQTIESIRSSGDRISIAVMPFSNMTNDTTWNVWQAGIQNEIINNLTNYRELKVRQPENINGLIRSDPSETYASLTLSFAGSVSKKLEADVFVLGTIKQSGSVIRITAQLISTETEDVLKSFQVESSEMEKEIFQHTELISGMIKNFLLISELEKEYSPEALSVVSTNSPEAYRYFMQGTSFFSKLDYTSARNLLLKALDIDSNFAAAIFYLSTAYGNQGLYDQAKEWCLKAYQKREQMPHIQKLWAEWLHANYFETPREEIIYLREITETDDQAQNAYYVLGLAYAALHLYDEAIPEFRKVLEIRNQWGTKPSWVYNYTDLGIAYHETARYSEERKLYMKAEEDFPGDPLLLYREAVLNLSTGKMKKANDIVEKYSSARETKNASESSIAEGLANIYYEAGMPEKAEEYYRKALSLKPENPARIWDFAWFLIDENINIEEGLELINKALELSPDNYLYLDTKGWGLYKQGNLTEALELLQKSWDLKPVYDHEIYLHLEKVKDEIKKN